MDEIQTQISENGDIYVHGRDEISFRVRVDGVSLAGRKIMLEIQDVTRRPLQPDNLGVLFTLTEEDLAQIPARGSLYVIRDETADLSDVLLDGKIRWHGWNKQ